MLATHVSSKLTQTKNCTARNTPRYRGALAVVGGEEDEADGSDQRKRR